MSDTKILFVVRDGMAVDAILVSAAAEVGKDGGSASWDKKDFPAPEGATFVDQDGAAIGWLLKKGALVALPEPEPPPAPLPAVISDRQFGQGLWHDGLISYEECEAFVSVGAIPKALQDIIDTLVL